MSVQVNVRFGEKIYERLEEICKREGYMSVPELVRDIVRDWLRDREKKTEEVAEVTA